AIGWTAEQTSWTNPGSVSAADRAPPPIVSFASTTSTARPRRARATAAASPFGPDPTTTASYPFVLIGERLGLSSRPSRVYGRGRLPAAVITTATTGGSCITQSPSDGSRRRSG